MLTKVALQSMSNELIKIAKDNEKQPKNFLRTALNKLDVDTQYVKDYVKKVIVPTSIGAGIGTGAGMLGVKAIEDAFDHLPPEQKMKMYAPIFAASYLAGAYGKDIVERNRANAIRALDKEQEERRKKK